MTLALFMLKCLGYKTFGTFWKYSNKCNRCAQKKQKLQWLIFVTIWDTVWPLYMHATILPSVRVIFFSQLCQPAFPEFQTTCNHWLTSWLFTNLIDLLLRDASPHVRLACASSSHHVFCLSSTASFYATVVAFLHTTSFSISLTYLALMGRKIHPNSYGVRSATAANPCLWNNLSPWTFSVTYIHLRAV